MVVVSVIAGLLAAFHGAWAWRTRLYPRGSRGVGLAVLDATWSLPNTVAGAAFLAYALARGNRVDAAFSRHRGTLGLRDGVIEGFATTVGRSRPASRWAWTSTRPCTCSRRACSAPSTCRWSW
ncbi:hypothetical protein AB0I91_00530 [Actinosynnema sp. NPDC049800]